MLLGYSVLPYVSISGQDDLDYYDQVDYRYGFDYDEIQTYNEIETLTNLFAHGDTNPAWTYNTILLMKFENNMDAGNFPTNDLPVSQWRILRRLSGTTSYSLIATITNLNQNVYYDVYSESGIEYEYAIQSVSNGVRGDIIESEAISVSFWGWIIQDIDYNPVNGTGESYQIKIAVETDPIKNVGDRTKFEGYSQFPIIARGIRKYKQGRIIATLIDNTTGECLVGTDKVRRSFIDFLLSGKKKVLKNGSGLTMVVDIDDNTVDLDYQDLLTNPDGYQQPFIFSFNFDEVGS